MKSRPNVALIVETSVVYGRQILHGISRYMRARGGWSVFLDERELLAPPPDWLLDWDGDGVICRPTTPALAERLRARGLAVVDLNDRYGNLGAPRIRSDMRAIGRMAAEHLLERGFRHIAFCGFRGEVWSQERFLGVEAAVLGRGELHESFESPFEGLREHRWQEERDKIAEWLRGLPRPLGVVACNDVRGHHVLDACRVLGLAAPEEVAVIGVDNAETFCDLCDPPLSSVVPDAERVGFEAAALLDRLMAGDAPPDEDRLLSPIGVVTRQSTDIMAVDDPAIARAIHFIRREACSGIGVDDVLAALPVSRSALERGFRRHLGHSPHEEIRRVRLKRVQQLLRETDWPLERIAEAAGYEYPEYMMVQFKRELGKTPTEWRRGDSIPEIPIPPTR
ncbi:XylR family transcriptional regulator [Capsulimonas corticalis]|uniref:XylR family transcriptional regulator n=1 Tax=Capsulimonas corticalis TaxID=2219043 RepID=A0A402CQ32_9BACT|nr:DNA-binding transcriptional regulator [Capsulimonas corticalis]BDI32799.1 XylR family transcriptional regulator [Capsulimonas corticalis]